MCIYVAFWSFWTANNKANLFVRSAAFRVVRMDSRPFGFAQGRLFAAMTNMESLSRVISLSF